MSELLTFARLGFLHITDVGGADHVLFLLALAAIYSAADWRSVLWVVTAFTAGHSLTLAVAVTGTLAVSTPVVEFLIPLTIVVTAVENVIVRDRARAPWRGRYRPMLAGTFGLVHGAGFATYLRSLFVDDIAIPLLGFNVGIELGQVAVLVAAFALLTLLDGTIGILRRMREDAWPAPRLRALVVSLGVALVAARWTVERAPW